MKPNRTGEPPKPRNLTVLDLRRCKCSVHGKTGKALRTQEKVSLRKEAY